MGGTGSRGYGTEDMEQEQENRKQRIGAKGEGG